jgi:uncharacterized protein YdhG (YjbR/CyaY superfamily)
VPASKKKETTAADVDRYLAGVPEPARGTLEKVRAAIQAAAPQATEQISYEMPTFKLDGRVLFHLAAWKKHCSLYPVSAAMLETVGQDPKKYDLSEKGTLRFPLDRALPASLVRKLVKARIAEHEARA